MSSRNVIIAVSLIILGVVTAQTITPPAGGGGTIPASLKLRPCELPLGAPNTNYPSLTVSDQALYLCTAAADLTITSVECTSWPTGSTVTVNPSISGGANLLTAPLVCGVEGVRTSGTLAVTSQTAGQSINNTITVTGTPRYVVVYLNRTL